MSTIFSIFYIFFLTIKVYILFLIKLNELHLKKVIKMKVYTDEDLNVIAEYDDGVSKRRIIKDFIITIDQDSDYQIMIDLDLIKTEVHNLQITGWNQTLLKCIELFNYRYDGQPAGILEILPNLGFIKNIIIKGINGKVSVSFKRWEYYRYDDDTIEWFINEYD